jgi:hypothetical protein
MMLAGNGHGCDPKYSISLTVIFDSSKISRETHCSNVSPGSKKPAKVEKRPSGHTG